MEHSPLVSPNFDRGLNSPADLRSSAQVVPAAWPQTLADVATDSLPELASLDLDAALQLLADRAQYVTGAGGAAIALRRTQSNDMLCRASSGSIAPQLGALLSAEFGLSGECVRTHRLQHCENAQQDARVNRTSCRQLGIASVLVAPILAADSVLGVFELFSAKPYAFDESDIAALMRLSAMVVLAIKFLLVPEPSPQVDPIQAEKHAPPRPYIHPTRVAKRVVPDGVVAPQASNSALAPALTDGGDPQKITQPPEEVMVPAKKPLFWSAADNARAVLADAVASPTAPVPPVLRNLQKCQACGFPVSKGRSLCVECEEKQWRGRK